jgi:hypothetical protein
LHSFGPDHVRLMSVDGEGKLTARPERYSVSTHDKPDTFVVASTVDDGLVLGSIDEVDPADLGPLVPLDTSSGKPSEECWLSISPDDRTVFATNFGCSDVTSYHINGKGLEIAKDPACPKGSRRRHIRGALWKRQRRSERQLGQPGRRPSLSDLRERVQTCRLRYSASRFVARYHARQHPYNSPQGLAGF